jgi:soluble cytochrome b562
VNNIQTSLTEFHTAAQSQFGPEVQQMRKALTDVQSAIRTASASPSTSSVTAIGTGAAAVVAAYSTLQSKISSHCG